MKNLIKLIVITLVGLIFIPPTAAQVSCEETVIYTNNDVYLALPNIFTPDNDGLNDLLVIYNSNTTRRLLRITDTTANNNVLFESSATDETSFWDGLDNDGMEAPEAAYNLKVDYEFETGEIRPNCRTIYLVRENCIDLSDVELDFPTDFDETTLTFLDTEPILPNCILDANELYNIEANIQPTLTRKMIMINSTQPVTNFIVYDFTGKTILSNAIGNKLKFEINVDELETGAYYLFLKHNQKFSAHQFYKK